MVSVTLQALSKTFPRAGVVVDRVDLQIRRGEFFTLLGPSGCGKSTALRIIAGFEAPTRGHVLFDGRDVTGEPPERRGLGFAFQNYALFPHLTVAENVAFGLKVRKVPRRDVDARVRQALAQVQLRGCEGEQIHRLSGGQQQRVALARALVLEPPLLLLDEPLSNLDASLRQDARALLASIHRSLGCTVIYVTHDQAEAMSLSDRVAVLGGGRVHQVAAPEEIYGRPATRFVAGFVGRNSVLDASIHGGSTPDPLVRFVDGTELRLRSSTPMTSDAESVSVCFRPESLRVTAGPGVFTGTVRSIEYMGASHLCELDSDVGVLRVDVPRCDRLPARGERVAVDVDSSAAHLLPREAQP